MICSSEEGHAAFDGVHDRVRLLRLVDCVRFNRLPLIGGVVDLRVSFCPFITAIPDLAGLRFLTVRDCRSLADIQCTSLDTLVVIDCGSLRGVPSAATEIQLSSCPMLEVLDGVETPTLFVSSCCNLTAVHATASTVTIEQCPRLTELAVPMVRELRLDWCASLARLQRAWPRVATVSLNNCASLARLPRRLLVSRETAFLYGEPLDVRLYACGVRWLEMGRGFVGSVTVSRCLHLESISGAGSAVGEMNVYACQKLATLPTDLPQLLKLRVLECGSLTALVVPPSATYVSVVSCRALATVVAAGTALKTLKIWSCPVELLRALPPRLHTLNLCRVPIELLPALPATLATLTLVSCRHLLSIPPEIDQVTSATVSDCPSLWPAACGSGSGRWLAAAYRASAVAWTPASHRLFGERLNAAMTVAVLAAARRLRRLHPDLVTAVFRRMRLDRLVAP